MGDGGLEIGYGELPPLLPIMWNGRSCMVLRLPIAIITIRSWNNFHWKSATSRIIPLPVPNSIHHGGTVLA